MCCYNHSMLTTQVLIHIVCNEFDSISCQDSHTQSDWHFLTADS